jgi:hypothetical protein
VACPEIYAPVCGCDGETYGNACEAAGHGVRVAHEGPCHCAPPPCAAVLRPVDTDGDGCPDTCRRPCQTACDCGPIPVANKADVCPLAALCPSPFCGRFWTCEEGFCQDHCGVVPPGTDTCQPSDGCASNDDCKDGELCFTLPGGCGGRGSCVTRPDVCPDHREPVCGCDGRTYGNACAALAAGVNVAARGECQAPPCDRNGVCSGGPLSKP